MNIIKHNSKGFGHVELVIAILFVGLFAFVGIRVIGINHAATLTSSQCSLLGRTFNSSTGACNKVCASGQGTYVVTSTYDYCSGAITAASKMSASTCASYGRKAMLSSSVYVGCARRADQKTTANAPQCANTANTYYVQSTYDKCAAPTTVSFGCTSYLKASTYVTSYGNAVDITGYYQITNNAATTATLKSTYNMYSKDSSSPLYNYVSTDTIGAHKSVNVSIGKLNRTIFDYVFQSGAGIRTTLTVGTKTVTCTNYF